MKKLVMLFLASAALVSATAGAMEGEEKAKDLALTNLQLNVVSVEEVKNLLRKDIEATVLAHLEEEKKESARLAKDDIIAKFKDNSLTKAANIQIRNDIVEEGRVEEREKLSFFQRHSKKSLLATLAIGISIPVFVVPAVLKWLEDGGSLEGGTPE